MTSRKVLVADIRGRLAAAGLSNPGVLARRIVSGATGIVEIALIAEDQETVPADQVELALERADRVAAGTPLSRVEGEAEFCHHQFRLSPDTLEPRPETALLVELAATQLQKHSGRVLDLGTGTGAIAISLAHACPNVSVTATDISENALAVARLNAEQIGVTDRVSFRQGSWFEPVPTGERFDLIVSNPPYIATEVIAKLDANVRDHDPALALDGGPDGLDAYRAIVPGAPTRLFPKGRLALEIGFDQGEVVAAMLEAAGLAEVAITKDATGHDRVVSGRLPTSG